MPILPTTPQALIEAMGRFNTQLRDTPEWGAGNKTKLTFRAVRRNYPASLQGWTWSCYEGQRPTPTPTPTFCSSGPRSGLGATVRTR
jgi:hypothetical protein